MVAISNLKTVFGMGGGYSMTKNHSVSINFTNKNLPHDGAKKFMRLINIFNAETGQLLSNGKIFQESL